MTKYIKHYYVDGKDLTTFLTDTNVGIDGKTHPRIDGLDVKFWFNDTNNIDYCMSVVPDTTSITPVTGLEEMSYTNWAIEVESQFNLRKTEVANDSTMLERLGKTREDVLAFVFDNQSVESMTSSFTQFNIPLIME